MLHSCNIRTARMCAAGIYGKVMADSCPGNDDNTRETRAESRKQKRKTSASGAQGAMAPALLTASPWQQAAGRNGAVDVHSEMHHMSINL